MSERCPHCSSADVIPILYGMPTPDAVERRDAGELSLGGCAIRPDAPTHACRTCGARFGRLSDDESLDAADES